MVQTDEEDSVFSVDQCNILVFLNNLLPLSIKKDITVSKKVVIIVSDIHPSLRYTCYPRGGPRPMPVSAVQDAGYTLVVGRSRGLTCRDKQPFKLTFTPVGKKKLLINLTCMSWDCGRKLKYLEETHILQTPRRQEPPRSNPERRQY